MRPAKARAAALLLLLCSVVAAETRPLTILHTNDVHARLAPAEDGQGGFAYLAAAIRRERAGCDHCILLNAGDLVQGTPVSTVFHGLPVYEVANLLGYDAGALGNHEFDYGWMQVRQFMKTARYPIVDANLVDRAGKLFTAPYVILRVNGLRVAVIGALTELMPSLSTPKLMGEWRAAPIIAAVRRAAAEVRNQSDVIVLLAHVSAQEEKKLLETVPEVPIVVTGHLHNGFKQPMSKDGRVLVRVKSDARELGRLDLQIDTEKKAPVSWAWKAIPISSRSIEPAADVAAQVKRWEGEVTARVDQPLAFSRRAFGKAQLKSLMERAMREQTGADFAFMNAGGVRDVLPQGQLLVRHIWNIMPFDNLLVLGKFRGKELPAVVLGNRKIDPDKEYTLAVSDYTAANQSAPSELRASGLKFQEDAGLLRDVLIDWFRKQKTIE